MCRGRNRTLERIQRKRNGNFAVRTRDLRRPVRYTFVRLALARRASEGQSRHAFFPKIPLLALRASIADSHARRQENDGP
jgi:hypothetical protein